MIGSGGSSDLIAKFGLYLKILCYELDSLCMGNLADFKQFLGEEGKKLGLIWGGDWGDIDHFEWHPGFSYEELKKYFEKEKGDVARFLENGPKTYERKRSEEPESAGEIMLNNHHHDCSDDTDKHERENEWRRIWESLMRFLVNINNHKLEKEDQN